MVIYVLASFSLLIFKMVVELLPHLLLSFLEVGPVRVLDYLHAFMSFLVLEEVGLVRGEVLV